MSEPDKSVEQEKYDLLSALRVVKEKRDRCIPVVVNSLLGALNSALLDQLRSMGSHTATDFVCFDFPYYPPAIAMKLFTQEVMSIFPGANIKCVSNSDNRSSRVTITNLYHDYGTENKKQ